MIQRLFPLTSRRRTPLTLALLALVLVVGGCFPAGYIAQGVAKGPKKVQVKARYLDLQNKKVAVMVAADEYTLFEFPQAQLAVARAVSSKIASGVPGVTLMAPQEVLDYQEKNPYWNASRYSELIQKLGVDRIVLIDLIEYRTHEPGNAHVWQGLISGEVGVIEADADDPDDFAFKTVVAAQYPENSTIGLLNSDDATVQLGMLQTFARDAAGLFFDHEIVTPE